MRVILINTTKNNIVEHILTDCTLEEINQLSYPKYYNFIEDPDDIITDYNFAYDAELLKFVEMKNPEAEHTAIVEPNQIQVDSANLLMQMAEKDFQIENLNNKIDSLEKDMADMMLNMAEGK